MKRFIHLFILLISAIAVGLYPLVCPIATAFAISSEFAGLDSSEVLAASSDGSGATVEQHPSVSDEGTDVDEGVIPEKEGSSVASAEANVTSASLYQYLYIAYSQLPAGTNQVIAFATPNDSDVVADATLQLESTTGHTYYVEAIGVNANSAAFQFGKDYAECGYDLISIAYHLQGDTAEHSVDLLRCGYSFDIASSFAVDNEIANNGAADSVYYSDDSGNLIPASSIGDALAATNGDYSIVPSGTAVNGAYVIALDPGHGGLDPGAQGNGKSEADLTWKIAVACKAKLERYGFKVVMSRDQFGSYSGNDYLYRVQRCVNQGAQAFVSFHINSGSSAAHGAEVYAPTNNGSSYTSASVELAQKVMNNLQALGLTYRGVFQMEIGDEFAVIRCAREQGIPGILIEHGFISNSGDVWNYFSDDGCRRLGEADADAIIAQFPRSSWMDYSSVFDADYYLNKYPDVAKWANNDKDKALQHFIDWGMGEGRRGNEAFDVYGYKTRYLDLRQAYGNDLKAYYNHYLRFGIKEGRDGSSMTGYEGLIMSPSFSSYQIAAALYLSTVGDHSYPANSYKDKGADSILEFCKILYEEASVEGVCPEVLYAQVMKETGYLKFGNLVQPDQCNFGGLGATGPGHPGYTFASVREGLRAQVQHLKAYATTEPLNNLCVDPRFSFVSRGCAPKTTDLNGRWAVPGIGYGESLNAIVFDLLYLK